MDRPAGAGLRHLALNVRNVRNLAPMKRFCTGRLGFQVACRSRAPVVGRRQPGATPAVA